MTKAWHRGTCVIALASGAVLSAAASPARTLTQEAAVDAIFAPFDRKDGPGCNVAVLEGDRVLLKKSYGMADPALGVPMRSSTSHWVPYSEARVFLALAVAMLARDDRISLDDPIRRHVPQVPEYARQVTVRQLLHHTSGLADYGVLAGPGFALPDRMSEDEFFRMLTRWNKLGFAPGTERMYSNTDYALLRLLVERVTGGSLDAYLRTRMFEPLGMHSTRVGSDQALGVPGHALFHHDTPNGYRRVLGYRLSPVGGIAVSTSLDDVLRWERGLRDPSRGFGALLEQLEVGAPPPAQGESGEAFAFGVHRRTVDGMALVEFRGISGYTWLVRAPNQGLSVATLCNAYPGMDTYAERVATVFAGKQAEGGDAAVASSASPVASTSAVAPPVQAPPPRAVPVDVPLADLQRYVGQYRDEGGVRVNAAIVDGKLVVTPRGRPSFVGVIPLGDGRFSTETPYDLFFAPGSDGVMRLNSRDRLTGEPGADELRRVEVAGPTAETARGYAGTYVGDELEIVLHVRADGDTVLMAARGMAEVAITPETEKDTFRLPDTYTARFERDGAGKVVALVLDANRLKGMRFSRQ